MARGKTILVHEHILVDFAGAQIASPVPYNRQEVITAAKLKLAALTRLGCVRMLECTPNILGRDPELLARLYDLTGVELWTNTGLYAANNYQHLPDYAKQESAEELAKRWIAEWRQGWGRIRSRFIKVGVNQAPLGEWDRKLVRAAALASRETGLTIASRTGKGAAVEQLEILSGLNFSLDRFVWVHAQNERDHQVHAKVVRAGAWVEFDGINPKTLNWHLEYVELMSRESLLGRTLLSQDSGWWRVSEAGGDDFLGYDSIYFDFVPLLRPEWWKPWPWDNPRAAFGR